MLAFEVENQISLPILKSKDLYVYFRLIPKIILDSSYLSKCSLLLFYIYE